MIFNDYFKLLKNTYQLLFCLLSIFFKKKIETKVDKLNDMRHTLFFSISTAYKILFIIIKVILKYLIKAKLYCLSLYLKLRHSLIN